MKFPNKIYVLGGSGSWKSSLAKKISKIKNIPHFDLDDIMRFKKYTDKLPEEQRKHKLHTTILQKYDKRVIEWCFVDWADECYKKADLVILLNVSKFTVAWRVFKRYIINILHWNFTETFRWVIWLMQRAMSYQNPKNRHSLYRHIEDCKKYGCTYIIIRDVKEILD